MRLRPIPLELIVSLLVQVNVEVTHARIESFSHYLTVTERVVTPQTTLLIRNVLAEHGADVLEGWVDCRVATKDTHHPEVSLQRLAGHLKLVHRHEGRLTCEV
jgi:hypothetical protein